VSTVLSRIEDLGAGIEALHAREHRESQPLCRRVLFIRRWALMLYREYLRDNVKIRAESLAFLMACSLLPLVAGAFFVFTIFTQFAMVQEALQRFVNGLLETIPVEHRETVQDFILRFKDAYLGAISGKSGRLGVFALLFLVWVGLQTFNNIERTINEIWSADRMRPFMERVRNFVVVSVGAPFVLIASLSIPLVLRKTPGTGHLLEAVPLFSTLLNQVIPLLLILATFTLLYRYVPVTKVRWHAALKGGVFSAVLLQLSNVGMNFYFRVGTQTAYGKAAVVPLIAFWVYIVWIIVIMGAEVSYLAQNEKYLLRAERQPPTLSEAEGLLAILVFLYGAWKGGKNPVSFEILFQHTQLPAKALQRLLSHLLREGLILEALAPADSLDSSYLLAQDIGNLKIRDVLGRFIVEGRARIEESPVQKRYEESLHHWLDFFGDRTMTVLAGP